MVWYVSHLGFPLWKGKVWVRLPNIFQADFLKKFDRLCLSFLTVGIPTCYQAKLKIFVLGLSIFNNMPLVLRFSSNEDIKTERLLFLLIFLMVCLWVFIRPCEIYKCCEGLNLPEPFNKSRASQISAYVMFAVASDHFFKHMLPFSICSIFEDVTFFVKSMNKV